MAETAGLAVGVIALCGLFNNAVDCFEYVQLGRNLGRDFQTKVLVLDAARLRLTRWGKSIGLGPDIENAGSLQQTALPKVEIGKAEEILNQIIAVFEDAEKTSRRLKAPKVDDDGTSNVLDADPKMESIHQKLRNLSIRRQGRRGLREKVKWALYEQKHFSRLVEDVGELVNNLIDLFPAAKPTQEEICKEEIRELGQSDEISVLKEVVEEQDEKLRDEIILAAIEKLSPQFTSHSFTNTFSGTQNQVLQLEQNTGTLSGFRFGG